MANLYFTHSSAPLKTVEEIEFGILAPEEIKNMSVCHIIYPETMDESRMKPRDGGLNDPLLGSIDRQFRCKTCTQAMWELPRSLWPHRSSRSPCIIPASSRR